MKKRTNDGSIIHSGDNTTGDAKGDDEVINIHLPQVSSNVETIWPVITIYSSGQQFDDVKNAYVRIIDPKSRNEFCRFNLSNNRDNISTGSIVGCIKRNGDSWTFKSLGYYVTNSKTCDQVVPKIK
jgi:stress response protein SCP2